MHRVRRLIVTALAAAATLVTVGAAAATTAVAAVAPSSTLGPPQAVVTADGNTQVFAVGGGEIWQNWQNPRTGAHGNWVGQPTPIVFVGTLSLVPRSDNRVIDIFARTSTDAIVETWYDSRNGAWGGWDTLGAAGGTGEPRAVATADGNVQVFIAARGQVEENWFDPRNGNHGQFASPRIAPPSAVVGRPAVVARPGNAVADVFVRAANGDVFETWYSSANGAWGGWIDLGGPAVADPSAVPAPPNTDLPPGTPFRDEVVINLGWSIAVNWFVPSNGHHGDYASGQTSAPTSLVGGVSLAEVPGAGLAWVDAFVRGADGHVYHSSFEKFVENIQAWVPLGGSTSNPPAAVFGADGADQAVTTSGAGAVIGTFPRFTSVAVGWRALQ